MNNRWLLLPLLLIPFVLIFCTTHATTTKKNSTHQKTHKKRKPDVKQKIIQPKEENLEIPQTAQPKHEYYIRVLLAEYPAQETSSFAFKSQDGFVLESPAHSNVTALFQENDMLVSFENGSFSIKCLDGKFRKVKRNDIEICSPSNRIILNNQEYEGSIHLRQDSNTGAIYVINKLELEDYLYSVIRHECVPSWPHEMQKIQAIVCRTFALYRMKKSRIKNPHCPYDLTNNFYCQVYKGAHKATHLRKAVEDTRNMVLTYKGNVVEAMFDICCGGIISKNLRTQDTSKPYLYRSEPCNYCKKSASYCWHEKIHKNDLLNRLKNSNKTREKAATLGSSILNMVITDKDKAGVVYKVTCTGKKSTVTFTGAEIKHALGFTSLAFSIKKEGNVFIFNGHGNHHFKGLCQWGAKTLVDQKWDFRKVLQYYYPNTKISYLK